MKIQIQLFSVLRDLLPPGAERGRTTVTLPEGATLSELVAHLGIDQKLGLAPGEIVSKAGWQVMVADRFEADMGRVLYGGDEVKILPPISGG